VEQSSTIGDVITVAFNLSVTFEDTAAYSVVGLRLAMTNSVFFLIFFVFLRHLYVLYAVSALEVLLVFTALHNLSFILITFSYCFSFAMFMITAQLSSIEINLVFIDYLFELA
jgi:hypothetical protein